jgi:predicted TPR repeat methyltransferase
MIAKARTRAVYDELVAQELCQFMRERPNTFDVIASADTLVYFGFLEAPLAAAREGLRPGGVLVFTVERLDSDDPFRLEPHGRYSHSEVYVRRAAAEAGFGALTLEPEVLRRERGQDVRGHLVLARRA